MSYKLKTIASFDKELKQLSKKYNSLKNEYAGLLDLLEAKPTTGTPIGKDCYKIRLAIKSKGKGKKRRRKGNNLYKDCSIDGLSSKHLRQSRF